MSLTFIAILVVTAGLTWWLSGYDALVTGHNVTADIWRRLIRCGVTLFLLIEGADNEVLFMGIAVFLAIIWAGCVSEMLAVRFHSLIEFTDHREFDSKRLTRDLDRLAGLVQQGRNEEALAFCHQLAEAGDASALAMETMLFRLYSQMFADEIVPASPPLAEAHQLRAQGRLLEAEAKLNALLKQQPDNLAAVMMLVRLYAQDGARPEKAGTLLQMLGQQRRVPRAFLEYARSVIAEWSGAVPPKTTEGIESLLVDQKPAPAPGKAVDPDQTSIDELLAAGQLGTAIERLEDEIGGQPENFDL
jgi:hypothetical protein